MIFGVGHRRDTGYFHLWVLVAPVFPLFCTGEVCPLDVVAGSRIGPSANADSNLPILEWGSKQVVAREFVCLEEEMLNMWKNAEYVEIAF